MNEILKHEQEQVTKDLIEFLESSETVEQFLKDKKFILVFSMLYNILEGKYFSKIECSKNEDRIKKFIEKIYNFDLSLLEKTFLYFKNRYTIEENFEMHFKDLQLEKNIQKSICAIFKSSNSNTKDKLYVVLHIIRRYRNNLYHGIKKIECINGQDEIFVKANIFLMNLIKENSE